MSLGNKLAYGSNSEKPRPITRFSWLVTRLVIYYHATVHSLTSYLTCVQCVPSPSSLRSPLDSYYVFDLFHRAMPGPRPVVLSGPSGAGKSTLLKRLMQEYEGVFGFSVSRKPRCHVLLFIMYPQPNRLTVSRSEEHSEEEGEICNPSSTVTHSLL